MANDMVKDVVGVIDLFKIKKAEASATRAVGNSFFYEFKTPGTLEETGSMDNSSSPYWWLNSGGQFIIKDGLAATIQGSLTTGAKFQKWYSASNPLDTENGYKPQNLLRLVTRNKWLSSTQEAYFKMNRVNMTNSPNRNASNGLLLMSRYNDAGATLYYAGIRVDGAAVIKKKVNGTYTTLAYKALFPNAQGYNSTTNPNVIPLEKWMGLRVITKNVSKGVQVSLYIDKNKTGNWELIAEAIDTGVNGGVISRDGYGGIRTDFADVEFDNYRISKL